ncbi:MAG: hypothetical protein IB618_01955 [Candidatus Pacearchaeota archaeon]|nr:MAG: hypothetical protein IB618_01955 [Candidatus Pacearchaeota archaeon]
MKTKFILAFILVVALFSVFLLSNARADDWYEYSLPDIDEMTVYVNGEMVWYGYCYYDPTPTEDRWHCVINQYETPALEREENAEIKVSFIANDDFEETKVKAWIGGYHDDIEAETSLFDVFEGKTYTKTLDLFIPKNIDARDTYTLHVDIQQKHGLSGTDEADIETEIQRIANWIEIMSVELYDSGNYYGSCGGCTMTFEAGTTLYVDVAVKNRGNHEAEDVYVRVSLNELCIERTIYLGDLEASDDDDDEDAKTVTVALIIPLDAYAGIHTLEVKAYNDEVSDIEFRDVIIEGPGKKEKEYEEGEVEIVPQITSNEIELGKGAVYTLLVANFGDETEDFIVSALGTEGGCGETACAGWAEVTINPQAFSLRPGESKIVNVYVAVSENAVEGEHIFSVKIEHDSKSEQYSMVANVVKEEGKGIGDLKTILTIVGIILAAAIIVLLILLLTTRKSAEKAEVEESYY